MQKSTNYSTLKEVENISENIRYQLSSEMDKIGAIQSLEERQGGASSWIMDCSNGQMNSSTKFKRGLELFPRTNDNAKDENAQRMDVKIQYLAKMVVKNLRKMNQEKYSSEQSPVNQNLRYN